MKWFCIKWYGGMFISGKIYTADDDGLISSEYGTLHRVDAKNHSAFRRATPLDELL